MEFVWFAVGLLVGAGLGWLLAARRAPAAGAGVEGELRAQLAQREDRLQEMQRELLQAREAASAAEAARAAAERQRQEWVQSASAAQADAVAQRDAASAKMADLARLQAQCQSLEQRLGQQRELHEKTTIEARAAQDKALADLREAFQALSSETLRKTMPEFLRQAEQTLGKYQEGARGDLDARREQIAALLKPLEEQLKTYQQRLQQSDAEQSKALGDVKRQLETLSKDSQSLANETLQFRMVLHSNQARGRWGEETLRRVVEAAGMSAHCDFEEQVHEGDSRPDMIIRLPAGRNIIVDSKTSELESLAAAESADPVTRAAGLADHARKVWDMVKKLADRGYAETYAGSLDFVILFLPAESLFSAALEGDRDLIIRAAQRKVMLATPASLIAMLRTISVAWLQHAQSENARQIAEEAQELFSRVATFVKHFSDIRDGLRKAVDAYNKAVGSYERSVRPQGERLIKLGGGVEHKELEEAGEVSADLRPSPGETI